MLAGKVAVVAGFGDVGKGVSGYTILRSRSAGASSLRPRSVGSFVEPFAEFFVSSAPSRSALTVLVSS